MLSYRIPTYLSTYMEYVEYDYVPWRVYYWHLNKISAILEHRASFKDFRVINL